MRFTVHANLKNSLSVFIGVCVVALALISLVVAPGHLPWLRYRILVWGLGVLAVASLFIQSHLQSKEEDERDIRERERDNLLAKLLEQKETVKLAPTPAKEAPSTPPTQPNQPHLMLTPTQESGKRWTDKPVFTLHHLSGEAAEYIEIDPIQSARGHNLWIRFDPIPFLNSDQREAAPSFWLDIGGIKVENKVDNLRFVFFRRDAQLQDKESVTYPVTVRFRHGIERLTEQFRLTWNENKQKLTVSPWN
jgi:hypothetical protein